MVAREQASIIEVGSSASRILGLSRKMRAIIRRCICPTRELEGILVGQLGELQVDEAARLGHQFLIFSFLRERLRAAAHAWMQSSSTASILLKVL
jgi:hypothetical protein